MSARVSDATNGALRTGGEEEAAKEDPARVLAPDALSGLECQLPRTKCRRTSTRDTPACSDSRDVSLWEDTERGRSLVSSGAGAWRSSDVAMAPREAGEGQGRHCQDQRGSTTPVGRTHREEKPAGTDHAARRRLIGTSGDGMERRVGGQ